MSYRCRLHFMKGLALHSPYRFVHLPLPSGSATSRTIDTELPTDDHKDAHNDFLKFVNEEVIRYLNNRSSKYTGSIVSYPLKSLHVAIV